MGLSVNEVVQQPTVWTDAASAAWVACALDGEGNISINKQSTVGFVAMVGITNGSLEFLAKFRSLVGGNTGDLTDNKRYSARHKPSYRVRLLTTVIVPVLEACLSHLVVKQRQ